MNLVDLAQIRSTVRALISPDEANTIVRPPGARLPAATLDVVNGSGLDGLATKLEKQLSALGLTEGTATTPRTVRHESTVTYAPDSQTAATALATALGGLPTQADPALASGHERVLLGTDFTLPADLNGATTKKDSYGLKVSGSASPAVAASSIQGSGIPCVQ